MAQRIQISGGAAGTVLYAYDEAGHLLGEYDATHMLRPHRSDIYRKCWTMRRLKPRRSTRA
jgi:hypothetical protein